MDYFILTLGDYSQILLIIDGLPTMDGNDCEPINNLHKPLFWMAFNGHSHWIILKHYFSISHYHPSWTITDHSEPWRHDRNVIPWVTGSVRFVWLLVRCFRDAWLLKSHWTGKWLTPIPERNFWASFWTSTIPFNRWSGYKDAGWFSRSGWYAIHVTFQSPTRFSSETILKIHLGMSSYGMSSMKPETKKGLNIINEPLNLPLLTNHLLNYHWNMVLIWF